MEHHNHDSKNFALGARDAEIGVGFFKKISQVPLTPQDYFDTRKANNTQEYVDELKSEKNKTLEKARAEHQKEMDKAKEKYEKMVDPAEREYEKKKMKAKRDYEMAMAKIDTPYESTKRNAQEELDEAKRVADEELKKKLDGAEDRYMAELRDLQAAVKRAGKEKDKEFLDRILTPY